MAAPVLEFGDDPTSPKAKMLSKRLCRMEVLVDLDVTTGIVGVRDRTGLDPVRRRLWWHDVQHVVRQFFRGLLGVVGDGHRTSVRIDGGHLTAFSNFDVVPRGDAFEFLGEHLHAEHARGGKHKDHPDGVENALSSPVVSREVGDFLRSACALDRPGRHGEHCCA